MGRLLDIIDYKTVSLVVLTNVWAEMQLSFDDYTSGIITLLTIIYIGQRIYKDRLEIIKGKKEKKTP